jgi:long-subunit acyl-CoA synthetase (AMP-forming)
MAAPTALLVEARRLERRRVALVIEPPVRVWRRRGDRVPRPTLTYAQLGDRIEEWHRLLDEKRLTAGSVVALRGDYSPEICALFLAIVLHRRPVVGLPQGEDIGQHLGAAHAEEGK